MARLIIVDPYLHGYEGHHYNFNLSIVEQAVRHGMEVAILANAKLTDPDIVSTLQAIPVFKFDQYRLPTTESSFHAFAANSPVRDPAVLPVLSSQLNAYFAHSLDAFLTPLVRDGDVIVFHSVTANMVAAAAGWLADNWRRHDFRTIFFMVAADYEASDGSWDWQTGVYEGFLGQLAELDPERLYISAETSEIAADLTRLSGGRVVVGVSPHLKPVSLLRKYFSQPSDKRDAGSTCFAACMGETRFEKGSHLMPGVVDRVADLLPERLHLIIQVNYAALENIRRGLADEARKSYSRPGVTVVDRRLSVDGYYARLKTPNLVVLPYTAHYAKAGSGVFWEAFAMGKPMVVPRDSVMARTNPGCTTFDEPTEDSVAEAVRRSVDAYPDLAAIALEAGRQWQRDHDPETFFDRFFGDNA